METAAIEQPCPICSAPTKRDRPDLRALQRTCTACGWHSSDEQAALQARELAQEIGFDPRDVDALEQQVRASAAVARAGQTLDELELEAREADAPEQVKSVASWRCEKCGGTNPDIHCNTVVNSGTPTVTSMFDDLEAALRLGAVLDVGSTPLGFHAIMETEDGGQFAQATSADLIGVLLEVAKSWKEAKPRPPPCCLKCHRELTGQLLGQHLNIEHAVPWCITFATERTRSTCIPPQAAQQLLHAAIRKQKAVLA